MKPARPENWVLANDADDRDVSTPYVCSDAVQIHAITKGGILRTYLPEDLEKVEKRNFRKRFQTA